MSTLKINLINTRTRLVTGRWIQGSPNHVVRTYCAVTAPQPGSVFDEDLYLHLHSHLPTEYKDTNNEISAIIAFNDNPKTTLEDVLALYDAAIMDADQ